MLVSQLLMRLYYSSLYPWLSHLFDLNANKYLIMAPAFVAAMFSWGLSHKLQIATAINFNYDILLLPYLPRELKIIAGKQKVWFHQTSLQNFQTFDVSWLECICKATGPMFSSSKYPSLIRKDAEYSSNCCVHCKQHSCVWCVCPCISLQLTPPPGAQARYKPGPTIREDEKPDRQRQSTLT